VIKQISAACDETIRRLNVPDSVDPECRAHQRSEHRLEDTLCELLSSASGLSCDSTHDRGKRATFRLSGSTDCRSYEQARLLSRPKLYAASSRNSSFRTFYFEPKKATNKVRDDAAHFIAGFEHERREKNGGWKFMRWDFVDLSHFKVKLES
jgi:hypothetical protein